MRLATPLSPVVIGPADFAEALEEQGVSALRVDWRPPPERVAATLSRLLGDAERYRALQEANEEAMNRVLAARCLLIDLRPARDVVPGLEEHVLLHAGPPLSWEDRKSVV